MDNFIESSIDYLFNNGGFDFFSGNQKFEFRIRKNGEIEVTCITNRNKKEVFSGEPNIYPVFAYLIFCDMYSSYQKSRIALCKDKNVSKNNLKALNRVYNIYMTMLSMDGKLLADALSSSPETLDINLLDKVDEIPHKESSLNYSLLEKRIASYAYDFARRYEFYHIVYDTILTTKECDPVHKYAQNLWRDLNNNMENKKSQKLSKDEMLTALFEITNTLERDFDKPIEGGEVQKREILIILLELSDFDVDIIDIICFAKRAFYIAELNERNSVQISDYLEVLEISFLDEKTKTTIMNELRRLKDKKPNSKVTSFPI